MKKSSNKNNSGGTIALNKKARHEFFIEEKFEAGVALNGWEVKALRASRGQITESYVQLHQGEAWLYGAQIQPLPQASTHFVTDPLRHRKLLLNNKELAKLKQAVDQKGHTITCLALYWKAHLVKCEIAIAKGKKLHDKRDTERERDWSLQKQRTMREHNK